LKRSRLKLDSSGFYHVAALPTFSRKQNGLLIQKFYVHGEIPTNELMNKKISAKMLSPSEFKVIVDLKLEFDLKNNYDAANMPFPKYLPSKPFSPVVGGCSSYPVKDCKMHKPDTRTTTLPNDPTKPTDIPSKNTPDATSTDTPARTSTDVPTSTKPTNPANNQKPTSKPTPTSVPRPSPDPKDAAATTTSDSSPKQPSPTNITNINSPDSSPNSSPIPVDSADQNASSTPLPGSSLGVLPIDIEIVNGKDSIAGDKPYETKLWLLPLGLMLVVMVVMLKLYNSVKNLCAKYKSFCNQC
ncbi:8418_t:CDS:2, partial [Racocetra fulgida]